MDYEGLLGEQPLEFLAGADEESERIVREHHRSLDDEPYARPGAGRGNRERLPVDGPELFRMQISRTYTALYTIHEEESTVRVREILPIDDAHKRYGY